MKNSWSAWLSGLFGKDQIEAIKDARVIELPDGTEITVTHTADCIGAACPRPQLVTMHLLEQMEQGEVLELVSDNPTTTETIPAMVMVLYCRHLATVHEKGGWRIYIQKEVSTEEK